MCETNPTFSGSTDQFYSEPFVTCRRFGMPVVTSGIHGVEEEERAISLPPPRQDPFKKINTALEDSLEYSKLMSFLSMTGPPNGSNASNESEMDLGFMANNNSEMYRNCINEGLAGELETTQYFQTKMLESFIPGAISNRTLEYLTESALRPTRMSKKLYSSSPGKDHNPFGAGTIGDRGGVANCFSPMFNSNASSVLDILNSNRSYSPPDSDASGNISHVNQQNPYGLYSVFGGQSSHTSNSGSLSPSYELIRALGLQSDIPLQRQNGRGTCQQPLYNDFSMSADLFACRPWTSLNTLFSTSSTDPHSIDRAAKLYRNAATISEPTCTWSGQLPAKIYRNPIYSFKVFLGGVPWDITEVGLQNCFRQYGPLKIEWPGKDGKHPRYPTKGKELPVGYVYILFEAERSVRALLQSCTHDFSNGGEYYFKISSKRMRSKEVQVIPWVISDSNFVMNPSQRLEAHKTVFVGALHGMLNAEGLAHILNDLFGNVIYAGIDTDKHKYPIGSGRVTFSSQKSYIKAVTAAFVEIKTSKFTKKIQIDPYLEESQCNVCQKEQGIYFCRDFKCFLYYCRSCWQAYHSAENTRFHKPLMRNNKISVGDMSQSK